MQPKKNPKADLAKSSGLFFAIGFAIVSGLTLWGFEAKVYDKTVKDDRQSEMNKQLDEEQENFVMEAPDTPPPPPPPPPPAVVEDVKIVENDAKIEEAQIATTETKKEDKVADVSTIQSTDTAVEDVPIDVPFTIIEDKPMFEACKGVPKELQLKCFKKELDKHIYTHLKYPSDIAGCVQGKVYIRFNINPDGTTNVTQVRSINKSLEKEAVFLIESLPCFTPGKHRGEIVTVSFAYPISFMLRE